MKSKNIYVFNILLISGLLVLSKYIVSYALNYEEDLFFKIFRLAYEDFESYALISESLSRLSLKTNISNIIISENIIGFPFLSLIWHSIFFKLFNYYSFIILEVIFYFLIIFLLFKIFFLIKKNNSVAFFSTIFLLLILETLILLSSNDNFNFFISNISFKFLLPLSEFYGQRFPHPLVTSVYFFSFMYIVAKINITDNFHIKKKYAFWLGVCSIFLINSFFHHFVKASLFVLVFFIVKYKLLFFELLKKNLKSLIIYLILLIFGFSILLLQLYFAEPDYFVRIGVNEINLDEKIYLLKILLKKLLQLEILTIIFFCFFVRYNYKLFYIYEKDVSNYDLLFLFFVSSLLSPYIFVIVAPKFTHVYYFWSAIKFSGFLFLFAIIIKVLINLKLNIDNKILLFNLCLLLIIINFYNNFSLQKKSDNKLINDRNEVQIFLDKKQYKNTDKLLFSNDYVSMHLWLKLKNYNIIRTEGFVSSYSDEIIENLIFNYFKMINIDQVAFKKILDENEETKFKRNNFAAIFNVKYSVNSVLHKKPIEEEYSLNIQERIKKLSPLVQWHLFFSNSEKGRLLKKYQNFKINKKLMPDIIILKKKKYKNIKSSLQALNYLETFSNASFSIYEIDRQ